MIDSTADALGLANPFPGLRPFLDSEKHLFFGRESQVDTMIDKLAAGRFLAVVGTSGSGKSSLVNCGLKPALHLGLMTAAGSTWRMAHFRPGSDPIKAMAQALVQPDSLFRSSEIAGVSVTDLVEATLQASKQGLVAAYQQAHLDPSINLMVIADQFEELFRYRNLAPGGDEKAVAFVNLLLEAAASPYPIYVVITMRSDFLGDCAQFYGLPEAINQGQYLVPRMTRDERRLALAGPVAVGGGDISPLLLTRLVNDVGDNPDQLSILQHALNRTWAQWQKEGGQGAMDLHHYETIGTMAHALDLHAEKAFSELQGEGQQAVCEKVFQAITDKGTDARGIRRPTSAHTLCEITGANIDEITAVLAVFRKSSRSFVMPPAGEAIASDTVIDISHESLMRIWNRLKDWVDHEADSASRYVRLVQNAELHANGVGALMIDPELAVTLQWKEEQQPTQAWGDRYRPGFQTTMAYLDHSRHAREKAVEAEKHRAEEEKERQRRELRRTRQLAAVMFAAFLLTIGLGSYALVQQHKSVQSQRDEAAAKAAEKVAKEDADEQHRLKESADLNAKEAYIQRLRAEGAEKQAEQERDIAKRTAQAFITAIKAQASAQLAAFEQLEKEEILQKARDDKASPDAIAVDQKAVNDVTAQAIQLRLDAARKSADAAAIVANAHLLSPGQISSSDLFDVSHGAAQVTGYSGSSSSGDACDPACGSKCSHTQNPADMLNGSGGSGCRATTFADGQQVGTEHWIEWKTKRQVTVGSLGLFAAHDAIRLRRSFNSFKFYVKKDGEWAQIAEYNPALMYGGSCSAKGCSPLPAKQYTPGSVLAACINIAPTTGQDFRAVFVQATSSVESFSGPRVLQLDGYAQPDCKK